MALVEFVEFLTKVEFVVATVVLAPEAKEASLKSIKQNGVDQVTSLKRQRLKEC